MSGCIAYEDKPCRYGLYLDEHLLIDGEWRHRDDGFTYDDEDVSR